MTEEERLNTLPLLEILAADDDGVPAGRVQLAGLALLESGCLQTGQHLRRDANGTAATENSQLVAALFDSLDAGLVRRHGQRYVLTMAGRATLEACGVHATEDARTALSRFLATS